MAGSVEVLQVGCMQPLRLGRQGKEAGCVQGVTSDYQKAVGSGYR